MSRKYRQRGYMESDRDRGEPRRRSEPPRRPLTPEERAQRRGLKHALDRDTREVVRCHVCGRNVESFGAITRETGCPHCQAPIHCCRACRHFDPASRWQCRAEIAEPVANKAGANDCEKYDPRLVLDATGRRSTTKSGKPDDPKSAFDNLFKR